MFFFFIQSIWYTISALCLFYRLVSLFFSFFLLFFTQDDMYDSQNILNPMLEKDIENVIKLHGKNSVEYR